MSEESIELEVRSFPKDYSGAFESIDPDHPYFHHNVGLFKFDVEATGSDAFVYMPPNTECSAWNITILAPEKCDPAEFLARTGWLKIANEQHILILLGIPCADIWTKNNESGYQLLTELDTKVNDKTDFDAQRFCSYLVSYGASSSVALRYVFNDPSAYASVAFLNPTGMTSDIEHIEESAQELLPYLPARDVPVPAYFGLANSDNSNVDNVIKRFVERNHDISTPVTSESRDLIYLPHVLKRDTINEDPIAAVAVHVFGDATETPVCAESAWDFMGAYIRTSGVGAGGLHPYRSLEDWGVERRTLRVDGIERNWIEYVPERNVSRESSRPLVLFLHGGSQSGATGMYAAEWMNVAESRDFILAMPTGSMRDFGSEKSPHPAWNSNGSTKLFNDEKFIRMLIDDIASRNDVDRSRIYVTGHSMGSAMTQRCALAMPDIFAACASNSGVVTGGFMGDFDSPGVREDLPMPAIWIQMGEHDVGGGTLENNHNAERTVKYWINRGHLRSFDSPLHYGLGRYQNNIWPNEQGIPLLTFTTTYDKPHSVMPQDAWFYYDEFFCKFSRGTSGELRFMGEPVKGV